jgi:ParB family chromosome partitioning protein
MKIVDLPIDSLIEASWNANRMDDATVARLRTSISRYGLIQNLVIRPIGDRFEVLSGNQRLRLLSELGISTVPCVVVNVDDGHARLLAQALNHIHGEDDIGLKAELVKKILESVSEREILTVLPETIEGLQGLASLGQETIAGYLQNWERARTERLRNLQFKLTAEHLATVEMAINKMLPSARKIQGVNPNLKGISLYLICKKYLEEVADDQ